MSAWKRRTRKDASKYAKGFRTGRPPVKSFGEVGCWKCSGTGEKRGRGVPRTATCDTCKGTGKIPFEKEAP